MYNFILLAISVGGFVFAASGDNVPKSVETSDKNNHQYCLTEYTSSDDLKVEAGRRRGKGNRGRRKGGNGLR